MSKSDYFEKLKDPRWQRKRLCVMERDQFKCRDCGSESKTLHVHHLAYQGKNPWDAGDDVLLTLCNECHEQRHEIEHDIKLGLARLMYRMGANELKELATSIVRALDNPDAMPVVMCSFQHEWDSDIRWHNYAVDHPEFRKAYMEVTRSSEKKGDYSK